MKLTMIGSGDAFGSGGRLQTCFHVETARGAFLIDCGATVMIGINRQKIDPNTIGTIYISHLHGDHFAGLVWFLMHAYYVSRRTEPLTIAGPVGIEERYVAATEALKEILEIGETLAGRLLIYDALSARFETVKVAWDPDNPLSGRKPTIRDLSIHRGAPGDACAA